MQGVGAALAGLVAELTGPGTAMAVIAAISVTVTLILAPGLRSGTRTTPVPSTARAEDRGYAGTSSTRSKIGAS